MKANVMFVGQTSKLQEFELAAPASGNMVFGAIKGAVNHTGVFIFQPMKSLLRLRLAAEL